ncbi:MAG: [glutamine synthetase] adenylyltransferase / [glutamine synthetase]-adenylyl-L-tyrosine [Frankiaceae bacterium]|nr:[glutamine synthetase] adenylyltransferase / [glutamine synthetase]-adenylyl-L-tyrosine [Frankiaceae bacterium]
MTESVTSADREQILALARLGFANPEQAARTLDARPDLYGHILDTLVASADPDLAMSALLSLLDATPDADELLAALDRDESLRAMLVGVLAVSTALGEHLVRHPDAWHVVADPQLLVSRPTAYGIRCALLAAVGADPGADVPVAAGATDEQLGRLRIAYRTALVRLAARDVGTQLDVADVAAELADLAGAALEAALAIARAGQPPGAEPCRLAIVAMGKCGGRELNYVSDVDVVFVAEPVAGGDESAALRSATRLAEGVIRACGVTTSEGTLWPVDAALRPEGKSGPLVRTLGSHQAYYRRWAKTWEFQALLKARPVAGDAQLGADYVATITPMVWSAGERPDFVADIRAMKRRVEGSIPPSELDRELKLGPGGLRDVEFAVQLLQLVHGRLDDSIRQQSTLGALQALAERGYVGDDDAAKLDAAYRFLRKTEHRLQLQRLRRTHLIPNDPAALRWLARSLGAHDTPRATAVEVWQREHQLHAVEVRRLHEKLFYRPLLQAVSRLPGDSVRLSPQAATDRLEALGFADPRGALRHLEAMTAGLSRRAQVLRTMLPVMLGWFADAHDPDRGLLAFRQVSEALGESPWFLALLRDSDVVAERLAKLLAASAYVGDLLARAPEGVSIIARDDELVPFAPAALNAEQASVVRRHPDPETAVAAARGVRRHELLRVACADLLGLLDVRAVGAALSDVADATIAAALDVAIRKVETERRAPLDIRFAVIGMGRLGGREQGYGSDADVLFVHDPLPGAAESDAADTALAVANELRRLLALPAPDPPLTIDVDLRPEGKQGALTRSIASFAMYYERWSVGWEAQALLRARFVAGDPDLGREFAALIAPVRWPAAFSANDVREIRRIKARVENERLPRGGDRSRHMKLGPGGLADIEWTVQLLQLQHAHRVPGLRTTSTLDALYAAAGDGLVQPADVETLATAWQLVADTRNAVMLVRGRATDVLPDEARAIAGVARALGFPAGSRGEFLEQYRRATRRARIVVERVFYG